MVIAFDLADCDSPLIVGIDFLRYADTCNRQNPRVIRFRRPRDLLTRIMFTYIAQDCTGNDRLRLEIVSDANNDYRSLLASHQAGNMASKIHRFSHAHADDIKEIFCDCGRLTPDT